MSMQNTASWGGDPAAPAGAVQVSGHSDATRLRGGVHTASDGCRLVHLVEGRGPTLVLVHGGLARSSAWIATADVLRTSYTCVLPDLRAHGASDWGGGPDLDRSATDLLELLDVWGPTHALVGHSYGALVALEAARRAAPGAVGRLLLYEPPLSVARPVMDDATVARVQAAAADGRFEDALGLHLSSSAGGLTDAEVEGLRTNPLLRATYADLVAQATAVAPGVRASTGLTSAEPYRAVRVPTRILVGTESAHDPFRTSAEALAAAMPRADIRELEGQSHLALLMAPHLVAAAVEDFVRPAGAPADGSAARPAGSV